jgi:hypothetical protein
VRYFTICTGMPFIFNANSPYLSSPHPDDVLDGTIEDRGSAAHETWRRVSAVDGRPDLQVRDYAR